MVHLPAGIKGVFSKVPLPIPAPYILLFYGYQGAFFGVKATEAWNWLSNAERLKVLEVIPPLPHICLGVVLSVSTGINFNFTVTKMASSFSLLDQQRPLI